MEAAFKGHKNYYAHSREGVRKELSKLNPIKITYRKGPLAWVTIIQIVGSSLSFDDQKALLRKELRKKLEALKPEERRRRSGEILGRLFRHPKFSEAESLLTYLSAKSEVETNPVVGEARRQGKRVYIPRLDSEKKRMWIIEVTGGEKLTPNRYGILEPPFEIKRVGNPKNLDLAVIPGLGFDPEGGRIGRGEGYFDRFLEEAQRAYKIGLAFECQMVDQVPRGSHDILMDEVLIG